VCSHTVFNQSLTGRHRIISDFYNDHSYACFFVYFYFCLLKVKYLKWNFCIEMYTYLNFLYILLNSLQKIISIHKSRFLQKSAHFCRPMPLLDVIATILENLKMALRFNSWKKHVINYLGTSVFSTKRQDSLVVISPGSGARLSGLIPGSATSYLLVTGQAT